MSYGFESYDDNNRLQITSEDPLLYAPLKQSFPSIGTYTYTDGSGNIVRSRRQTVSQGVLPQNEMIAIRANSSGVFGFLQWANGNYLYTTNGLSTPSGTLVGSGDLDYIRIKSTGDLTPGTGYGMHVFDSSGDLTFTTSSGETIQGYLDILSITQQGATNSASSFPGMRIYNGNAATWDGVCVIANNLGFKHEYWFDDDEEPLNQKSIIFSRTVWFDHANHDIYACEFGIDGDTVFDPIGTTTASVDWTNSLNNTYYVVRYV